MEKKRRSPEEIQKIKEKIKKGAIIVLPVAFALIATVSVALLVGSMNKADEDYEPRETSASTKITDVQVVVPSNDDKSGEYSKGLEYTSNSDGTCDLVGMGSCGDRELRIPSQSPSGERVVRIGDGAFKNKTSISEVIIPTSVMEIGKEAFRGSGITAVTVPSSVVSVGESAFARCLSLKAINVDSANPVYASADGILFDREMTTLICYPSGKSGSTYTISKSVTKISPMAFSSCTYLVSIKYEGTEKQWKNVYVCVGNDSLTTSSLTFAPQAK